MLPGVRAARACGVNFIRSGARRCAERAPATSVKVGSQRQGHRRAPAGAWCWIPPWVFWAARPPSRSRPASKSCGRSSRTSRRRPTGRTGLEEMNVLERDAEGRVLLCESVNDAKVKTVKSIVRFSYDEPNIVSWEQEKGDLRSVVGSWELEDARGRFRPGDVRMEGDPGRVLGMTIRGPVEGRLREILVGRAAAGARRARRPGLSAAMDLGLRGRRALVTAGSRGIGRAIAAELVAEGASVCISSRSPRRRRLRARRRRASPFDSDDVDAVPSFVASVESASGRPAGRARRQHRRPAGRAPTRSGSRARSGRTRTARSSLRRWRSSRRSCRGCARAGSGGS